MANSTNPSTVSAVLALCLLTHQDPASRATRPVERDAAPPGYSGTFPGDEGTSAAAELAHVTFTDRGGLLGGGEWEVSDMTGPFPVPLGPAQRAVISMRYRTHKGPHVELTQGERVFNFPTETDGDVAALWQLVKGAKHPKLTGEPSAGGQRAWEIVRSFGVTAAGLRAGLVARPGRTAGTARTGGTAAGTGGGEAIVYNATDRAVDVSGKAGIEIDGRRAPFVLRWPPRVEVAEGGSRVQLAPGESVEQAVDLPALAQQAKVDLADGKEHRVTLVFDAAVRDGEKKAGVEALRSGVLSIGKR